MYEEGKGSNEFHTDFLIDGDMLVNFKKELFKYQNEENLTQNEIITMLEKDNEIFLPVSIFENRKLGVLEIIVKYLREELNYSLKEIGVFLNRNNKSIWSSLSCANKKYPDRIIESDCSFVIPLSIFKNRSLAVLEVLVMYLKNRYELKFSQIGRILCRDHRTIWTVYNRAKKKQCQK
jgi:hypothetical protein